MEMYISISGITLFLAHLLHLCFIHLEGKTYEIRMSFSSLHPGFLRLVPGL